MIVELARIIVTKENCQREIILELQNLLEVPYNRRNPVNGSDYDTAYGLLQQMRSKNVCRDTWCDHHRDHFWRENEPRCFTIGGLQLFFKKNKLLNAAKLFEDNRERIEKIYYSKQYSNFGVHGWCSLLNFLQRCRQGSSLKSKSLCLLFLCAAEIAKNYSLARSTPESKFTSQEVLQGKTK